MALCCEASYFLRKEGGVMTYAMSVAEEFMDGTDSGGLVKNHEPCYGSNGGGGGQRGQAN